VKKNSKGALQMNRKSNPPNSKASPANVAPNKQNLST